VERIPLAVPDTVIDALRAVAGEDGRIRSWDSTKLSTTLRLRVGDSVKLGDLAGPLAGLTAQISSLVELDRSGQVKVWLDMLGGRVDVRLDYKLLGKVTGRTSSSEMLVT
jgi:transcription antitermination factor NusG